MEFWGIEIKAKSTVKVEQEEGWSIHVSQVALGELKNVKEGETVPIYVKVGSDNNKFIIGNLSQKIPQVQLDLIFEKFFEISHDSKSSVFLLGYKTLDEEEEEDESDFDLDEEEVPMECVENGGKKMHKCWDH